MNASIISPHHVEAKPARLEHGEAVNRFWHGLSGWAVNGFWERIERMSGQRILGTD